MICSRESVVVGERGAGRGLAGLAVVPDGGCQGQDALEHAGKNVGDDGREAAAVVALVADDDLAGQHGSQAGGEDVQRFALADLGAGRQRRPGPQAVQGAQQAQPQAPELAGAIRPFCENGRRGISGTDCRGGSQRPRRVPITFAYPVMPAVEGIAIGRA
jgi:hypothetical protein